MGTASAVLRFKGKKIAVLMGGLSSEREISLRSGENVLRSLQKLGLSPIRLDVKETIAADIQKEKIDLAFLALHGKYGEDGCIQGLLDILDIPYTGSGVLGSAVGMNKIATKRMFAANNIPTPESVILDASDPAGSAREIGVRLGFPCILKPAEEGSSIGVVLLQDGKDLDVLLADYLVKFPLAYAEKLIRGREITVGLIGCGSRIKVLPVMELKPRAEFYDFEAKYTQGRTEFVIPAPLARDKEEEIVRYARTAYRELNLSGVARMDAMLDASDNPFFLEVNTIPGMTETSDIPAMAKAAGLSFEDVVTEILAAVPDRGRRREDC